MQIKVPIRAGSQIVLLSASVVVVVVVVNQLLLKKKSLFFSPCLVQTSKRWHREDK